MKVAMTLDGRIAPPVGRQHAGEPYWITSEAARAAVQPLRWQADAAMVGVDTVVADDPLLTDRSGNRRRRPLLRIVLDSALRMPLDSKLVATAHNDVLVFTVSKDEARTHELRAAACAWKCCLPRLAACRSAKCSISSAKKASSRCSPKPARGSTQPCSPPAWSTASISSSLRRSWVRRGARLSRHGQCHPHGRGRSGALRQRLGLCSLLKDPWNG